jgi:hypothetical protein
MDLMTTMSRFQAACFAAADLHRRVHATCEASARLRRKAIGLRRRVRFAIGERGAEAAAAGVQFLWSGHSIT